jgi:hypothetical protein
MYTVRDDCQDHRAARAQRAVSLRLRPQIQAVLFGKGQCRADRRQRSGCRRRSYAAGRSRPSSCEADDKTSDRATVEGVNLACVRATPARAAQGGRQLKRIVVDHWGLVDGGVAVVFGHKLGSSNLVLHRRARAGAQTLCGRPNFTPNHAPPAHQPDGPAPPERRLDGPLQPGPTLSASPPLHVLDVDRGFAMFAAQQFWQVPGAALRCIRHAIAKRRSLAPRGSVLPTWNAPKPRIPMPTQSLT